MSFRQSETASIAAAKAGFSAATAYRMEQDPRLPSQSLGLAADHTPGGIKTERRPRPPR